jgi:hypothetical protein
VRRPTAGVADDDDLGGVGIVLGEIGERRRAVDEAVVLDGQLRRVLARDVTEIHVPGARTHVDEAVIGEGIVGACEVQDAAARKRRILARDAPVVEVTLAVDAGEGTGRRIDAAAAAVEVEHDLGRVGQALPEGELAAIGAHAVTTGHDLVPLRLANARGSTRLGAVWRRPTGIGAGSAGLLEEVQAHRLRRRHLLGPGCPDVEGRHDCEAAVRADLRVGVVLDAVVA